MTYDSTGDTLKHSRRVGELMGPMIKELIDRSTSHDLSKTEDPELATFNEFTPKLQNMTYGSSEYRACLDAMAPALEHHYANNRHHPEFGEPGLEWRPIASYEGAYEVNNYGDVRSVARVAKRDGPTGNLSVAGRVLRAHVTPKGYLRLQLSKGGRPRSFMVHRLVAETFIPNPDNKPEVNHRNGNKRDNRATNLEWATESENQTHAYQTGLKEAVVKHVVHCPELDLTTMGAERMAHALQERGYAKASPAGVWRAMHHGGQHCGLTFEGTRLAEYRRGRLSKMTLVDLIEMLADWQAAGERHADGSLRVSLELQRERFGIDLQLMEILHNTAVHFGWLEQADEPTGEGR
ncbi:DUF5662 family protein [Micromonospora chalcea]|uniref:DUF5662 family protein n=1 Tax=Micromonospora chalcea TaxID=1874 RepID=UPI003D7403DC